MRYIVAKGFYDGKGNVVILLKSSGKLKKIDDNLFEFVMTCYHEARHIAQDKLSKNSYEFFLAVIEDEVRKRQSDINYYLLHDDFSYEIGANLYGIEKTKEYLKKRYPYIYEKEKEKIQVLENKYTFEYLTYNATYNFDRFYQKINKAILNNCIRFENILEKFKPFKIFFNEDGSFKTITEIIQNENTFKIDSRIVSTIISSKSFIETVNLKSLTKEELEFINKHLNYTNSVYNNQLVTMKKYKNQKGIDLSNYLKKIKNINISFIYNLFKRSIIKKTYLKLTKDSREHHKEIVRDYLDKTQEEINKKR